MKPIEVTITGTYTDLTGVLFYTQSQDGTKYEIKVDLKEFKELCKFIYEDMKKTK